MITLSEAPEFAEMEEAHVQDIEETEADNEVPEVIDKGDILKKSDDPQNCIQVRYTSLLMYCR